MLRSGGGGGSGTPGQAATIAPGTATSLAPGASPTVTNSGSSSAAVFNFGIPAGTPGTNGNAATIAPGTVTMAPPGTSPTVTNSGTSSAATFNFLLPYPSSASITYLQGAAGWTATNTAAANTVQTPFSVTMAANTMNQGTSQMDIELEYSITGTAATKTLDITDHATGFIIATIAGTFGSSGYAGQHVKVSNKGTTSSQYIRARSITVPFGTGGTNGIADNTGSLDMTQTRTLDFNVTFSTTGGTETVIIKSFSVRVWQ